MSDHRIVLGDCLDSVTGLASLADGSVDHAIFDAPYSEKVHTASRTGATGHGNDGASGNGRASFNRNRDLGFEHLTADVQDAVAKQVARLTRRWVLAFCDAEGIAGWRAAFERHGLEPVRVGAWIKEGATPQFTGDRPAAGFEAIVIAHPPGRKQWNGGGRHALWTCPIVLNRGGTDVRVHTTQKPIELMEALVRDFTDPGELILDPFAGSGTTGVACRRLGRRFLGWERDAKYAEVARKRIDGAREQMGLFAEGA